jgi:hypothetical protein
MQRRTGFAVTPALAALAFAVSAIALAPAHAAPGETCLAAPKGVAPQGSHWYYRIDRPSQRKCWYVAEEGRKIVQRSAARTAPQHADPADEDDAAPALVAATPAAAPVAASPSVNDEPQPAAEALAPKITTLITRNVSNADQSSPPATDVAQAVPAGSAQSAAAPNTSSPATAEAPVARSAPVPSEEQAPRVIAAPPPAPAAAPQTAQAASATAPTLQVVLGGIAFFGLVASAAFFILTMLRRRNDVLNLRHEADLPFQQSPELADDDGATFHPLRALDPIRRRDDVEEALQRVMRRRRAAA